MTATTHLRFHKNSFKKEGSVCIIPYLMFLSEEPVEILDPKYCKWKKFEIK